MIVDSSALVAIIRGEPGWERLLSALKGAATPRLSSANFLETAIVLDRSAEASDGHRLTRLLDESDIEVVPFTAEQAQLARRAYRDFGRGAGHPAQLNFGDCFAYALAEETGEPLLYKGEDFTKAGARHALPPASPS